MSNLRDQILAADDLTAETMTIPEWGDAVIEIRTMTAEERTNFMGLAYDSSSGDLNFSVLYAAIVIASVYDPETGLQLFTQEDGHALGQKNGAIMERIATKAMEMSGLTEAAVDDAGKGFSTDPTDDTSTN